MEEADAHLPSWLTPLAALGREVPLVIEDYTPGMTGEARLRRCVGSVRRAMRAWDEQ